MINEMVIVGLRIAPERGRHIQVRIEYMINTPMVTERLEYKRKSLGVDDPLLSGKLSIAC